MGDHGGRCPVCVALQSGCRKIIAGINKILFIKDRDNPDFGVWYRVVDKDNIPVDPLLHDWINYAPQMLDLPCRGVNNPQGRGVDP